MRYLLMFPLTALFLLACGDIDNPVVPTAPAGKATVDYSEAQCAAAVSLPEGFLEQARAVDPDIDEALLLSMWQAHGCADWALWGLIWLASLDADLTFDVEVFTTPVPDREPHTPPVPDRAYREENFEVVVHTPPEPVTDFREENFDVRVHTPPEPVTDFQHTEDGPSIADDPSIEDEPPRQLSTVSVSGVKSENNAVFTFTRTGALNESVSINFWVNKRNGDCVMRFLSFGEGETQLTGYTVSLDEGEVTITLVGVGFRMGTRSASVS